MSAHPMHRKRDLQPTEIHFLAFLSFSAARSTPPAQSEKIQTKKPHLGKAFHISSCNAISPSNTVSAGPVI